MSKNKEFKELLEMLDAEGEVEVELNMADEMTVITSIEQNTYANIATGEIEKIAYVITGYGDMFYDKEYVIVNKKKLQDLFLRCR